MPFKGSSTSLTGPVWVAFCDAPGVGWLQIFRPGFRHCFMILRGADAWVTIDPLWGELEIMTHPSGPDYYFLQQLKKQGLTIVKIDKNSFRKMGPGAVFCTCVGIVKRALGLADPMIWTPYQLYRALLRHGATPLHSQPGA